TMVEFFEGGSNKIAVDSTAPYSFTWTNVAEGTYTLTAKATDNEGGSRTTLSSNITVQIPVDVTGVDLIEVTGPIAIGASIQVEAIVSPANATNSNVVFDTDDPSIATVTENGLLTAISEGMVTLTVTTNDGGFIDSQMIEVLIPSSDFNWALGQPIDGTGTPDGNNDEGKLVDGNTSTRWSVNGYPQSATVDLEGDIKITQTEVTCYEDRAYQFIIEGSLYEAGPYTTIIDRSNNRIPGIANVPIINSVDSVEARFVRITVTGADVYTGAWVSLSELRVFGEGERIYTGREEELKTEFTLSPNPATSDVTIKAGRAYHTVSIYDASGRRLIQTEINLELALDTSMLPAGLYLVKIEGNDRVQVTRLVKH
ncbi:MAG: T9SS type A sorting domain-containing protein, partial [Bacteroidia bacterium]|nr:T9SS type A sorting domain-containing protein [Bacteroidia bacterium]